MVCSSCPFCCVLTVLLRREQALRVLAPDTMNVAAWLQTCGPNAVISEGVHPPNEIDVVHSGVGCRSACVHNYNTIMYTITTNLLNRCRPRNSFARRLRIHSLPSYSNWIFNAYIAFAIQRALCIAPGFRMGA